MIIKLYDHNFSDTIYKYEELPVLVDFWTSRCELCRYIAPILDELHNEMNDRIVIGKFNVDEGPYTVGFYKIYFVPMIILFFKGIPIHSFKGLTRKDEIMDYLRNNNLI